MSRAFLTVALACALVAAAASWLLREGELDPSRDVSVLEHDDGGASARRSPPLPTAAVTSPGPRELEREGVTVSGVVVSAEGAGAAHAHVWVPGLAARVECGERGEYRLHFTRDEWIAIGNPLVLCAASGNARATTVVHSGDALDGVRLSLEDCATITGRVAGGGEGPVSVAYLPDPASVTCCPGLFGVRARELEKTALGELSVVASRDGSFEISGVPGSEGTLVVRSDGRGYRSLRVATVCGEILDVGPLDLIAFDRLRVTVAERDGGALEGARVDVRAVDGDSTSGGTYLTDSDGAVEIGELVPGSYEVTARCVGFAAVSRVVRSDAGDVEFGLTRGARVVLVTAGRAVDAQNVSAATAPPTRVSVSTGPDGVVLEGLIGDVHITVSQPGYVPETRSLTGLEAGELRHIPLSLVALEETLTVCVGDARGRPIAEATVTVRSQLDDGRVFSSSGRSGPDGCAEITDLPAGPFRASVAATDHVPRTISASLPSSEISVCLDASASVECTVLAGVAMDPGDQAFIGFFCRRPVVACEGVRAGVEGDLGRVAPASVGERTLVDGLAAGDYAVAAFRDAIAAKAFSESGLFDGGENGSAQTVALDPGSTSKLSLPCPPGVSFSGQIIGLPRGAECLVTGLLVDGADSVVGRSVAVGDTGSYSLTLPWRAKGRYVLGAHRTRLLGPPIIEWLDVPPVPNSSVVMDFDVTGHEIELTVVERPGGEAASGARVLLQGPLDHELASSVLRGQLARAGGRAARDDLVSDAHGRVSGWVGYEGEYHAMCNSAAWRTAAPAHLDVRGTHSSAVVEVARRSHIKGRLDPPPEGPFEAARYSLEVYSPSLGGLLSVDQPDATLDFDLGCRDGGVVVFRVIDLNGGVLLFEQEIVVEPDETFVLYPTWGTG